jgi:hypothetical protein
MAKYRVKEPGFYGGIYREPGGKHDPVVTARPIPRKKLPSWLEEVDEEAEAAARQEIDDANADATQTQIEESEKQLNETPEDFMGDQQVDDKAGVESF